MNTCILNPRKIFFSRKEIILLLVAYLIMSPIIIIHQAWLERLIQCAMYLSYWHQIDEGVQSDPAQQHHRGQGGPQLVSGRQGRRPLEHAGLLGSTHGDQEQHSQGKKCGNANGTWVKTVWCQGSQPRRSFTREALTDWCSKGSSL